MKIALGPCRWSLQQAIDADPAYIRLAYSGIMEHDYQLHRTIMASAGVTLPPWGGEKKKKKVTSEMMQSFAERHNAAFNQKE